MICSFCGAKNSDTRQKCFNCGKPLYNNYTEGEYTQARTSQTQNTKKASLLSSFDEEDDFTPVRVTRKPAAQTTGPQRQVREQHASASESKVSQRPHQRQESRKKEKKPLDKFSIAIIILAILFASLLTVTGILVYNNFFKEQGLGSNATAADLGVASPKIEVLTDANGEQYVNATFFGQVGDKIYFSCNESYATFVSDTVERSFYLKDVYSAETEFLQATATIDFGAAHVRESKHYPYSLSPTAVSVLSSEMEVVKPSEKNVKSYDDFYTIKMWAQPGSTVKINGVDVSQKIDVLGNLRHDIETKANAITTCYIEVSHPYRTPSKDSFIISRDAVDIDFKITKVNISGDTCTITATGAPNAKITANLPLISASHNDLYNNYSIKLDLSSCPYGEVDFVLTAETQNGKASRASSVIYWPSEASATQSAKALSASNATSPKKGTQYVIANATVTRAIGANTFEIETKIDGKTYYLALKYENSITPVEIGSKYKFFAAGTGSTHSSGIPILKAWYIYPL